MDELNFVALFATLMAGTAALPHIVTRFFAEPTRRSARLSAAWGALFVLVLLITLPALAAFAKLALFKLILAPTPFADLPAWFERLSRLDLVRFHGVSLRLYEDVLFAVQSGQTDVAGVTGVLKSHAAPTFDAWVALKAPAKSAIVESAKHVATASGVDPWETLKTSVLPAVALISGNKTGALTHSAITIDADGLLYLLPGLSSAPTLTAWLIGFAVLAAVLSTCTGVALTLANALSSRLQAMRLVAAGSIVIARVRRNSSASCGPADDRLGGVLPRRGGAVPGSRARLVVEARQQLGSCRWARRGFGRDALLHRRYAAFSGAFLRDVGGAL